MIFVATVVLGLVGTLASLLYLLEFARASRVDSFRQPAPTRGIRWARLVTGMYARDGVTPSRERTFDASRPVDDRPFADGPQHDRLAVH